MIKKILVVDDDHLTVQLVESILKTRGYDVISLLRPKHALRIVEEEHPDLVILDIIMPDKNGYKVCAEIKQIYGDAIKVILFTAQDTEKDRIQEFFKEAGADDFIIKPFETKAFLEKIEQMMRD